MGEGRGRWRTSIHSSFTVSSTNRCNSDPQPLQAPGPAARAVFQETLQVLIRVTRTVAMSQAATRSPLLGPTSCPQAPGPVQCPMRTSLPLTWSALSCSLRRLRQAAHERSVSGQALATFLETPPRPPSQTSDRSPDIGRPHCPMRHGSTTRAGESFGALGRS